MRTDHPHAADLDLADLLQRLVEHVEVLRESVDELREDVTWELRNLRDQAILSPAPFRLTTMPLDACAEDFHRRVNAIDPATVKAHDETVVGFLAPLMKAPLAATLISEDWAEDHEFTAGEVVEIDQEIFDIVATRPGQGVGVGGVGAARGLGDHRPARGWLQGLRLRAGSRRCPMMPAN